MWVNEFNEQFCLALKEGRLLKGEKGKKGGQGERERERERERGKGERDTGGVKI